MNVLLGRNGQHGSSAIELALSLPLLLLILWGIVTFGSLLNARMVVARAAEDAARSVSFLSNASRIEDLDPSLMLPCTSAAQTSITCEAVASMERSLTLFGVGQSTSRFDAIRQVASVEVSPSVCEAAGSGLGIKVRVPFSALRILPAISIPGFDFADWMPSDVTACAVAAL